ncbi:hypothetical protein RDI58_013380 [Solanum bulbocastanum]|uniref:Uncharacterized protein n=1 Tax=Solanum bulbocastanum TaxID=147425 RepID=A0AAN8YE19_SOLBU
MNLDIAETTYDDIKFLAQGPAQDARRFSAYNINGFKFRTLSREQGSKTQNVGVFLISDTSCIASSVDRCARQADLPYYGKLEDIIELNYYGRFKVDFSKLIHMVIARIMIHILKHHKQIWSTMLMMRLIKNGVSLYI